MPLEPGSSRKVVGGNIKREEEAGKPKAQAIAIALKTAGLSNQDETEHAPVGGMTLEDMRRKNKEYWKQSWGE